MRIFDFVDKIDGVLAEALAERVQYDKDGNKLPGLADAIKARQDAQNQTTVPGTLKAGDGSTVVSGDGTPVQAGTQPSPAPTTAPATTPTADTGVTVGDPIPEPTATATPTPITTPTPAAAPAPKQWAKGVLGMGSTGPEVIELQKRLGLKQDGKFGTATRDAVINLQKKLGVKADGAYGPATKAADSKETPDFLKNPAAAPKEVPTSATAPTTDPMGADDGASIMAAAGTAPTTPATQSQVRAVDNSIAATQPARKTYRDLNGKVQRVAEESGFDNDELNRLVSLIHYR